MQIYWQWIASTSEEGIVFVKSLEQKTIWNFCLAGGE